MDHPFFDRPTYPLHRPDARDLLRILVTILPDKHDIVHYYQCAADGLKPLTDARADLMWEEALRHLAAAHALESLFDVLLSQRWHPQVLEAIERVRNARPGVDRLVGEDDDPGVVILDRADLRQQIRRLTPANAPLKVIVVRGDPLTGKSHGRHLFELAAQDQGAQPVYLCAGMVATVDEVLGELFGAFGATSEIPPPDTTGSAYYRQVWLRLREIAEQRNRPLWVAVDDLGVDPDGAPLLDAEIRELFDQLVVTFPNPPYRTWFRLMLIHYPEGRLPTRWRREVWAEERPSAEDVRAEHVADVLRSWSVRHGRAVVDEEINALAADIVARADKVPEDEGDQPSRLQRIHDLVSEALESLVGVAG
ncbi:MAG TPA: hypothetical protein VGJ07_00030 [Rugosimonospora sp.]|jgi:hypothetical protein